jgi:hypothetical protein
MELGALHPISGRQWQLTDEQSNAIWPDCCLVVPFGAQVADATGTIVNGVTGESVQGGWTVTSTLQKLELTDLVQGTKVAGVTAVWAAGPGGDTPALQVLGNDPFSWLAPHLDVAASSSTTTYPLRDQWFGGGPAQLFWKPRRFGEVVIAPVDFGLLLAPPTSWLGMRVLRAPQAQLSVSYPSGKPIVIDQLWLGVLVGMEEPIDTDLEDVVALDDGWSIGLLPIPVGGGTASVEIPFGGSILFVRYRRRPLTAKTPERITLQPGHYELTLSGATEGKAPMPEPGEPTVADASDLAWSATQRFWVEHPPSLRSYVRFTTLGDDRLFGPKAGFDPTLEGVGFPGHGDYLPVVRFCVPYVKAMFQKLRLRVDYSNPKVADVSQEVDVVANTAGESTLPDAAQAWKAANGGTVLADDEVVMTNALPAAGPASLRISHLPPAGEEFELDSWGVQISRFANAATHLAWPGTSLTRRYRFDGPHDQSACPTIGSPKWKGVVKGAYEGPLRAHELLVAPSPPAKARLKRADFSESIAGQLLLPIGWVLTAMPEEYSTPPDDWPLPNPLAALTGPLGADAAKRFLLFLWRSGVRLAADASAPRLAAVGDPVASTTIQAVCDPQNRPVALWLRTPEPIDWRRIHAEMQLRHVEPGTGCPTAYAHRHTMKLAVRVLPSTDGSSALLVARFGGVVTRLPRGEVNLKLTYEPSEPGLVKLRPRTPLPSGREELSLTFLQPFGATWPVKPSGPGDIFPRIPRLVPKRKFGPPEPGPYRKLTINELADKLFDERGRRR